MPISLFIEHYTNGLAFYINGDLQFDTADEAFYHEYLVIPPVALTIQRFPHTDLQVLICGGGDGLVARDVLRFSQVCHIDLVDYNPDVLDLAQTVFKPFNQDSLASDRVIVHCQEALEFVSTIPDNSYHVIICDFTYPTRTEETSIYSREWFHEINRVLRPSGLVSTNGVSPEKRTTGFWCIYQTILSAGLNPKPLHLDIPSFRHHGYGNWGFFLASVQPISRLELASIELPDNLKVINLEKLVQSFVFTEKIAQLRHSVAIHTLDCPQLFYYLLNPELDVLETDEAEPGINFLDIQESGTAELATRDSLNLESVAQVWLEQLYQTSSNNPPDINQLLPVQHRYHNPKMAQEWLAYLKQLLSEIDLSRLLNSLLERSQELPPQIASELKQLAEKLRTGKPLVNLPPKTAEFVMMLSVTLLMANLVTPDVIFAKGFYSGGGSNYSNSGIDADSLSGDNLVGNDVNWMGKFFGVIFITIGGLWLYNIFVRPRDD
ncbi:MAG TPA: hypothetical protein V6C95_07575 [Coleofasciculaceae cyanobacterium]